MSSLNLNLAQLDAARRECLQLVNQRAWVSAAAAAIPLPGLDVGADVAIMTRMIEQINEKFGLREQDVARLDAQTRQRLLVIITSIGSSLIGRYASKELIILALKRVGVRMASKQAAKFVPLLGTAIAAGVSYGAMRYLGNAHIEDCYRVLRQAIAETDSSA
jgi:uncharacterized protein (DUF697 family)